MAGPPPPPPREASETADALSFEGTTEEVLRYTIVAKVGAGRPEETAEGADKIDQ